MEAAGALFAQALLRGALDVIDVVFVAGAYRRILTLGGGRLTLRAVLAYLAERVNLLMARLRQGAGKLSRLVEQAQAAAKKKAKQVAAAARRLPKYRTKPPFEKNPNHSQAKYERQIQGQQEGLNNMTVEEYLQNSDSYKQNGRAPSGDKAQQAARELARKDKIKELIKQGKTPAEAKAEADAWMKTQNALHNPDQIAGGHPDHIEGMGDAGVNKSIGSQWRNKGIAKSMDDEIRRQAAKMTPEERRTTKLNVELDH